MLNFLFSRSSRVRPDVSLTNPVIPHQIISGHVNTWVNFSLHAPSVVVNELMLLSHCPCDVQRRNVEGFTRWPRTLKRVSGCVCLWEKRAGEGELMALPLCVPSLQRWCGSICPWSWSTSACCSSAARCWPCSCASGPGSPPRSAGVSCSTPSQQSSPSWEVRLLTSLFAVLVPAGFHPHRLD